MTESTGASELRASELRASELGAGGLLFKAIVTTPRILRMNSITMITIAAIFIQFVKPMLLKPL